MSTGLYWRPLLDGNRIGGFELRECINKKFKLPCRIDYADSEYIEGLSDAGIDGAKELLEKLEKYEYIELWEES